MRKTGKTFTFYLAGFVLYSADKNRCFILYPAGFENPQGLLFYEMLCPNLRRALTD